MAWRRATLFYALRIACVGATHGRPDRSRPIAQLPRSHGRCEQKARIECKCACLGVAGAFSGGERAAARASSSRGGGAAPPRQDFATSAVVRCATGVSGVG